MCSLSDKLHTFLFDFVIRLIAGRICMSGCREGRTQPEIAANNFRLCNTQRSLDMTVTPGFTPGFIFFSFHSLGH